MGRSTRHNQRTTRAGYGVHYTSPLKPRDTARRKVVIGVGHVGRQAALRANLQRLLANVPPARPSSSSSELHIEQDVDMEEWQDEPPPPDSASAPGSVNSGDLYDKNQSVNIYLYNVCQYSS
ncbi:hypothetical protein C8R45DRAFT_1095617 [Mycena sanguinolenta]|nr:hypothetical protein C8R45DRAFT_1095617 [Mycena sanguinolenta]